MAETPPATFSTPDYVTVFKSLGYVLSARALLLLALIGAFVLAVMAMVWQTLAALEVFSAYAIFAVIPVAYLETRRGSGRKTVDP